MRLYPRRRRSNVSIFIVSQICPSSGRMLRYRTLDQSTYKTAKLRRWLTMPMADVRRACGRISPHIGRHHFLMQRPSKGHYHAWSLSIAFSVWHSIFQSLQLTRVEDFHPAKIRLVFVERRCGYCVPASYSQSYRCDGLYQILGKVRGSGHEHCC